MSTTMSMAKRLGTLALQSLQRTKRHAPKPAAYLPSSSLTCGKSNSSQLHSPILPKLDHQSRDALKIVAAARNQFGVVGDSSGGDVQIVWGNTDALLTPLLTERPRRSCVLQDLQ